MRKTLNIMSLLGVVTFCLKYYFLQKISLGFAGAVMIFVVILAALNSPITNLIKVAITILSFGLFLADYFYDINSFKEMLQPILIMLLALFGIYLMVNKFFGSKE